MVRVGVITVWEDERGAQTHLYAQRLDADGVSLWAANGVEVCAASTNQTQHRIAADGSGGVFIVWTDHSYMHSDSMLTATSSGMHSACRFARHIASKQVRG